MSIILAGGAAAQSIVVQGNQRVDTETVRSYFSGERLDQAGILPPAFREGSIGPDARALGAAAIPLSQRYLLDPAATRIDG